MTEEAEDPGAASDATVDLDLESDDDDAATVELNSPASAHGVQVQVVARPSVVVPPPVPPRLGTRDHSAKSSPYWQRLRPVDHLSLSPRSGSWTEFEGGKQSSTPAAPDSPKRAVRPSGPLLMRKSRALAIHWRWEGGGAASCHHPSPFANSRFARAAGWGRWYAGPHLPGGRAAQRGCAGSPAPSASRRCC